MRTAWLYGLHGRNFVKTMLRLARTRRELTVVHDQRGTPTWTRDLARQLAVLLPTEHYGVYHASAQGSCSWYEFAVTIFQALSMEVRVRPVTSEEFPRPARRPKNSVLENRRLQELGLDLLPPWEEAFHRFLKELAERGPLPG